MPVDARLLQLLACPDCHGELDELDGERGLECRECGRIYPIRDGIPVMMVEHASPPTRPPRSADRDDGAERP